MQHATVVEQMTVCKFLIIYIAPFKMNLTMVLCDSVILMTCL